MVIYFYYGIKESIVDDDTPSENIELHVGPNLTKLGSSPQEVLTSSENNTSQNVMNDINQSVQSPPFYTNNASEEYISPNPRNPFRTS